MNYKVDCKSNGSPPVKREVKPVPMNFPGDSVPHGFGDKTGSQQHGAELPAVPPRKWKHRHINRHFSSTSDHPPEVGHRETAVKTYQSPSWLVAEQPVPLSSVCHQGLPVVKKGSPVPSATILPNDLSRRFLAESTDVGHTMTFDADRSTMLRKRRLDDRRDVTIPFTMSPSVPKFPAFNYGINPADINPPNGYDSFCLFHVYGVLVF